jgi:RND family efflux transporter MFP subunit
MKKLLVLLSFIVSVFAMGGGPSLVEVQSVKKMEVNPLQEFIGSVNLSKQGSIASQTTGKIEKVFFETAQKVKKGDILVKIDSKLLDLQIKSAKDNLQLKQISLKNAKKEFDRYSELKTSNAVSEQVYDNALLKYDTAKQNELIAKNSLSELEIQKSYKTIKAPYDGVIASKSIEVGEWASVGGNVATLINTSKADLVFNLPSSYTYKLGNLKSFEGSIQGQTINAKLKGLIPQGNKKTRTFLALFTLDSKNLNLFDGMEVKIKLPREKKVEALVVPRDAVISKFGQKVVFANNDGKALMLPVQIINYLGDEVAIGAQGLQPGMDVVSKGNERIFPNSPIKPINKK